MGISFIRTIILYFLVVVSLRIMGKRQIGELQPSELVVAIMVSDLATIPMQDTRIPLLAGAIPILTLIILEVILSFISMKNKKFREFVSGKPSILVHNGQIVQDEMDKQRFTREDLLEELRMAGCDDITEIQYAVLETTGNIGLILKKDNRPLTLKDAKKLLQKKEGK